MVQALRNALVHESLRLSIEFGLQWRFLSFSLKYFSRYSSSVLRNRVVFSMGILLLFIEEKMLTINNGLRGLIPTFLLNKLAKCP